MRAAEYPAATFVDGTWHQVTVTATSAVHNPATGELITHATNTDPTVASQTVTAASHAFPQWAETTYAQRSTHLAALARPPLGAW